MAKLDDLEFRITASMGDLTTALDRGSAQINQFTNRTAAGFTRLDNRFTQVAGKLRGIFSLFGIGFGVRAFSGWIKDAIEVEKLTAAQAKSIGEAAKAMQGLQKEFGNLARTAATELAPALEHAAKFWKEFFFPSGSQFGGAVDALRPQVEAAIAEVERLQRLTATQTAYNADKNWFQSMLFGDIDPDEIAANNGLLAAARVELERLTKAWHDAMGAIDKAPADGLFEMQVGAASLPDDMQKFIFSAADSAAILNGQLKEVQVTINKMPADLKVLSPEFNHFVAALGQPLEDIETEAQKTAEAIGMSFQHAFSDWLFNAELDFKDFLKRMAADLLASALFKGMASLFPGGSFFASFFGGSRATGGDVSAGKMYRVHEGEGFFSPGMNGRVGAAGAGGGVTIVNNIDARGADPSVAARLPAILAENNQRVKAEIRHELGRRR